MSDQCGKTNAVEIGQTNALKLPAAGWLAPGL